MRILLVALITSAIGFSCQQKNQNAQSSDNEENWTTLFNGKNLDGFRFYKNRENNSWEVVDGALHCKPFDSAQRRADIITTEQFENFELSFEWKISHQGNSGVMFRVTEAFDEPYFSGPEYQIIDDENYPGDLQDVHKTGANYDMHAPNDKTLKPVGEWNETKLIVDQQHVEHWLNGKKVVSYDIRSEDWNKRKSASKWKDAEGYAQATQGYIAFQDHGNEVWFRNIKVRKR